MPRYFFRLADGTILPDQDGLELTDKQEAWSTGLGFLSDVVRIRRDSLQPGDGWSVTVTDERNASIWRLSFQTEALAFEAAAPSS